MKRSWFTEERIIGVRKDHEAGAKTADLACKRGVSEATLYNGKANFGGMEVSEAKRLQALGYENAKPKKLLAEPMLDVLESWLRAERAKAIDYTLPRWQLFTC